MTKIFKMKNGPIVAVSGVVALLCLAVALLFVSARKDSSVQPAQATQTSDSLPSEARLDDPKKVRQPALEAPTAVAWETNADFLADHWGADWPRVREHLVSKGHESILNDTYAQTPTWDEVEAIFRDFVTNQPFEAIFRVYYRPIEKREVLSTIRARRPGVELSEEQQAELLELALTFEQEIEALAVKTTNAELQYRSEAWRDKAYSASPLLTAPQPEGSGDDTNVGYRSHYASKWSFNLPIDPNRDYQFANALSELNAARRRRSDALVEQVDRW